MDIQELSSRTQLGMRRLRYVIEYNVLPPVDALKPGRGLAREFDEFMGFCIAVAASLLEMGVKRKLVEQAMAVALEYRKRGLPPGSVIVPVLENTFGFARRATLEIGDGRNLRIVSDPSALTTGPNTIQPMSLAWTQMDTLARLERGYEPTVVVVIRLDVLSRRVRQSE